MAVYKCAADGCYNQVDERGALCAEHTGVEYVSVEDYVRLARLLSAAELRDYIGVEVHDNGIREWGRKIDKPHQNVSRNLSKAREKLDHYTMTDIDKIRRVFREEDFSADWETFREEAKEKHRAMGGMGDEEDAARIIVAEYLEEDKRMFPPRE